MNIKKYNKLVRDKIPSIVGAEGQICVYEVENDPMILHDYVARKIIEESWEVVSADGRNEILEELADLLAVMIKFGEINGIKSHEILSAMVQKEQRCGKFDNNFILKEIRTNE